MIWYIMQPPWYEIQQSLADAIRAAFPLQLQPLNGEPISGLGLHIDSYYGSAGLYLLPLSESIRIDPEGRNNIGDWPISTDWDPKADHAIAFDKHWRRWDRWFCQNLDALDQTEQERGEDRHRMILRIACQAVHQLDTEGVFNIPKSEDFKLIIIEHNEPDSMGLERYPKFLKTGEVEILDDD